MAQSWQEQGAPRLHLVDLDGAKEGRPVNHTVMAAICAALGIEVEVSGGLRDRAAVDAAFAYGAARVQLGSAAVRDPGLVRAACASYPGRIVVSIDSRNGEVMTDGWLAGSGVATLELARSMIDVGVTRLMFTDISRDGALAGPNVELLATLVAGLPVPVVASGGVATLDHVRMLATSGCEGVIVGKALYEGAIRLADAIAAAKDAQTRGSGTPC